jgi:hypothetical protein
MGPRSTSLAPRRHNRRVHYDRSGRRGAAVIGPAKCSRNAARPSPHAVPNQRVHAHRARGITQAGYRDHHQVMGARGACSTRPRTPPRVRRGCVAWNSAIVGRVTDASARAHAQLGRYGMGRARHWPWRSRAHAACSNAAATAVISGAVVAANGRAARKAKVGGATRANASARAIALAMCSAQSLCTRKARSGMRGTRHIHPRAGATLGRGRVRARRVGRGDRKHGPRQCRHATRGDTSPRCVVPRGLEPRTLRLLAVRSDQLSYETSSAICPRATFGRPDSTRSDCSRRGRAHMLSTTR